MPVEPATWPLPLAFLPRHATACRQVATEIATETRQSKPWRTFQHANGARHTDAHASLITGSHTRNRFENSIPTVFLHVAALGDVLLKVDCPACRIRNVDPLPASKVVPLIFAAPPALCISPAARVLHALCRFATLFARLGGQSGGQTFVLALVRPSGRHTLRPTADWLLPCHRTPSCTPEPIRGPPSLRPLSGRDDLSLRLQSRHSRQSPNWQPIA